MVVSVQVLLKWRRPQMFAQAYRFSIAVMWHSGAKKLVVCQTVHSQLVPRGFFPSRHRESPSFRKKLLA